MKVKALTGTVSVNLRYLQLLQKVCLAVTHVMMIGAAGFSLVKLILSFDIMLFILLFSSGIIAGVYYQWNKRRKVNKMPLFSMLSILLIAFYLASLLGFLQEYYTAIQGIFSLFLKGFGGFFLLFAPPVFLFLLALRYSGRFNFLFLFLSVIFTVAYLIVIDDIIYLFQPHLAAGGEFLGSLAGFFIGGLAFLHLHYLLSDKSYYKNKD